MAHRVGEGRLLSPQNVLGQDMVIGKGLAEQIFAHVVVVHFQLGVNAHHIAHKVQIAERHSRLDGVYGDAAVGPEHIVHVKLVDPLLGLVLERLGAGSEVGVLVAEQLVGNLAGQQHPDVGLLVDGLAAQIHAHAGPDGGDVPGAQHGDDLLQGVQHLLAGHKDLRVVGTDVVGHFPGVLQVDGVLIHADGEGTDLLSQHDGADGAHQGGVQAAGEQEAQGSVSVQSLVNAGDQLVADVLAGGLQIVVGVTADGGQVGVTDELSVGVIVTGREGADLLAQADEVLGLAGEHDTAILVIAVEQRPDADGVPGGDEGVRGGIVDDEGELGVQPGKHAQAVLVEQGQQDLAVAAALEGVALLH